MSRYTLMQFAGAVLQAAHPRAGKSVATDLQAELSRLRVLAESASGTLRRVSTDICDIRDGVKGRRNSKERDQLAMASARLQAVAELLVTEAQVGSVESTYQAALIGRRALLGHALTAVIAGAAGGVAQSGTDRLLSGRDQALDRLNDLAAEAEKTLRRVEGLREDMATELAEEIRRIAAASCLRNHPAFYGVINELHGRMSTATSAEQVGILRGAGETLFAFAMPGPDGEDTPEHRKVLQVREDIAVFLARVSDLQMLDDAIRR